jgi:hypothetical protein
MKRFKKEEFLFSEMESGNELKKLISVKTNFMPTRGRESVKILK